MQNLNVTVFLKLGTEGGMVFSQRKARDPNEEVLL